MAVALVPPGFACLCIDPDLSVAIDQIPHVFVARILTRESAKPPRQHMYQTYVHQFEVLTTFKGEPDSLGLLETDAICGTSLEENGRYLLYLNDHRVTQCRASENLRLRSKESKKARDRIRTLARWQRLQSPMTRPWQSSWQKGCTLSAGLRFGPFWGSVGLFRHAEAKGRWELRYDLRATTEQMNFPGVRIRAPSGEVADAGSAIGRMKRDRTWDRVPLVLTDEAFAQLEADDLIDIKLSDAEPWAKLPDAHFEEALADAKECAFEYADYYQDMARG